jgi:hypothetical protein
VLLAAKLPTLSEKTFVELYHMTQGCLFSCAGWSPGSIPARRGSEEEMARFIHQVGASQKYSAIY